MLYVYFGNKEQLYAEVLRASFRSAAALAQVQDDPNVDPVKHIRSIITEFFHFVAENPGFVRLVGWENLRYRSSNVLADILGVGLHGLYATVERGKRLGVIRPDLDAQKTVLSVTTLCIG